MRPVKTARFLMIMLVLGVLVGGCAANVPDNPYHSWPGGWQRK